MKTKIAIIISSFFFMIPSSYACLGCGGGTQTVTLKLLAVGMSFFLLPAGFVLFLVWRLWKDSKSQR